jgi:SAM-dependent methyltransferase
MEWTGERYVTSVGGEIEFEHTHRYLFAMKFAEGAMVLDIASGEGYGSALLGSVADRVIGIDIDEVSVAHARSKYKSDNLSFLRGDCTSLPLSSDSVDLVASFETLEHILDHKRFFKEISRVLRSDGVLVISTPDRVPYNDINGVPNPCHLKELDRAEFKLLLKRHFKWVQLLGQCYLEGSLIDPLKSSGSEDRAIKGNKRWVRYIEEPMRARKSLARAIYLVGVASNQPLRKGPANLLTTTPGRQPRSQAIRQAQSTAQGSLRDVDQLRSTLGAAEEQQRALSEIISDRNRAAEALQADINQRAANEAALGAEVDRRTASEATLRAEVDQRAANEAALRSALDKAERDSREHAAAAEALRGEIASSRIQLAAAERSARERGAAAEVMQREITSLRSELAVARDVGSAALTALRTLSAPMLETPRNANWLTVALRPLGLRSGYPVAVSPVVVDG